MVPYFAFFPSTPVDIFLSRIPFHRDGLLTAVQYLTAAEPGNVPFPYFITLHESNISTTCSCFSLVFNTLKCPKP